MVLFVHMGAYINQKCTFLMVTANLNTNEKKDFRYIASVMKHLGINTATCLTLGTWVAK